MPGPAKLLASNYAYSMFFPRQKVFIYWYLLKCLRNRESFFMSVKILTFIKMFVFCW